MYTDEALLKLLESFDGNVEETAIAHALLEFITKAGYVVSSVEFSVEFGESRLFSINFQDEYEATLFATAFAPLGEEELPLDVTNATVFIKVD